jgi:hypothetical protein
MTSEEKEAAVYLAVGSVLGVYPSMVTPHTQLSAGRVSYDRIRRIKDEVGRVLNYRFQADAHIRWTEVGDILRIVL